MEAPTDGMHVRQPQSLITDGAARRRIKKGTQKKISWIQERKKDRGWMMMKRNKLLSAEFQLSSQFPFFLPQTY
jgi:hypothetical protein